VLYLSHSAKNNDPIENVSVERPVIDERIQLRTIVFGAAENKFIEQIILLRNGKFQLIN
jgi:hypothetical protein